MENTKNINKATIIFGDMLSHLQRIPEAFEDVKKGNWEREKFKGNNLYGKTLNILCTGKIAKTIEKIGKAFNMKIIIGKGDITIKEDLSIVYNKRL